MQIDELKLAVEKDHIEWQRHALERMTERGISRKMVKDVLVNGELVEDYHDDKPYPSSLFFGKSGGENIHVVAAYDSISKYCAVITAYKPDLDHFESDYKTRRIK